MACVSGSCGSSRRRQPTGGSSPASATGTSTSAWASTPARGASSPATRSSSPQGPDHVQATVQLGIILALRCVVPSCILFRVPISPDRGGSRLTEGLSVYIGYTKTDLVIKSGHWGLGLGAGATRSTGCITYWTIKKKRSIYHRGTRSVEIYRQMRVLLSAFRSVALVHTGRPILGNVWGIGITHYTRVAGIIKHGKRGYTCTYIYYELPFVQNR
jgi:hypothetical protein